MSTLIIGANGSMGTRYRAIFDWLDVPYWAVDRETSLDTIKTRAQAADRILLCTPTITHYDLLKHLIPLERPILCEKPIVKDLDDLNEILTMARRLKTPFNMVMQYEELLNDDGLESDEESVYDYFRHGNDGLVWDCLQIIALANGDINIDEKSPIWTCQINGQKLDLAKMDQAYVSHVRRWLSGGLSQDINWLFEIHEKTAEINGETNEQYN